jgi:hypothetical protein
VARAAGAPAHTALIEPGFHLLAAVGQFPGPHHLPGRVVHQGHPRRLAAGVDLEPQLRWLLCRFTVLEDEREGVTPDHGRPSPREQMPRSARVDWGARPVLLIDDEHQRHGSILSDSPCRGKVPLVRVWER